MSLIVPFSLVEMSEYLYVSLSCSHSVYVRMHTRVYPSVILGMYVYMYVFVHLSVSSSTHPSACLSFSHLLALSASSHFCLVRLKLLVFPVRMNNEAVFPTRGMSIFLLSGLFG